MNPSKLTRTLNFMREVDLTPPDFVLYLLNSRAESHKLAKDTLINSVCLIFNTFSIVLDAVNRVKTWAHEAAKSIYMQQVQGLTHPTLGFHFNAINATAQ
jgi:hypothetical protein